MKKLLTCLLVLILPLPGFAQSKIINVYAWTGQFPESIIRQFETETGIRVNLSYFENNEVMYAKLRAMRQPSYDIVMPSSYFVDRMGRQGLLEKIDKSKLSNWHHLNPQLLNLPFDPNNTFSMPLTWGVTGMFLNKEYFPSGSLKKWTDLWDKKFYNKLLLLDDTREIFSMALISLGYPPNDSDPEHIKAAYLKLKELMQNVKVFSSDTIISIMIDEDATVGMSWNGDTFKAWQENHAIEFIYPEDGFVIWMDNIAIAKNAPHEDAAYAFINFILRPEIAKAIALFTKFPIANLSGQKLLPPEIQNNPNIYPSADVLKRGQYQTDVSDEILRLYEKYWEALKISG